MNLCKTFSTGLGLLACAALLAACASSYTLQAARYQDAAGEVNQHERFIAAPPEVVFNMVTDKDRIGDFCPPGTTVTYLSPPPYAVGHKVETRVDHIFNLKWMSRVQAVAPLRRIQLTFLDGFFQGGTEIWEFQPQPGGTLVRHTIVVQPAGWIRRQIWRLKVRRKHDIMVEHFLDNLKQAAEMQPLDPS